MSCADVDTMTERMGEAKIGVYVKRDRAMKMWGYWVSDVVGRQYGGMSEIRGLIDDDGG